MSRNIIGSYLWKKMFMLIVVASFCIVSLCSCGVFKRSLLVYVDVNSPLFYEAVEEFRREHSEIKMKVISFESYEEMKEKMNAELMGGKGPDVILFNGVYDMDDSFKMSASGSLLALDDKIAELDEASYFTPILDAGITISEASVFNS